MTPLLPPVSLTTLGLCLAWYLVLSFTSQLTKVILGKMTYPFFLSQAQFFLGTILSYGLITMIQRFPKARAAFGKGIVPDQAVFSRHVLLQVLPLGVMQFVGKYCSLSATLLVPVATVASVKSLLPVLIVSGYRFFYRVRFPLVTYLLLTPLLAGVLMMIAADAPEEMVTWDSLHMKGLIFCVAGAIIMACQHIYGKELLTRDPVPPASLVLNTDASRPATPAMSMDAYFPPLALYTQRREAVRLPNLVLDLRLDELPPKPALLTMHPSQKLDEGQDSNHTAGMLLSKMNLNQNVSEIPSLNLSKSSNNSQSPKFIQNYTFVQNEFPKFLPNIKLPHLPDLSLAYLNEVHQANNPLSGLGRKPDKFTVIFYISLIGFCFSMCGFLFNEAGNLFASISDPSQFKGKINDKDDLIMVAVLIVVDSVSHFVQTVLAFLLLASIPALSYSIASMLKRIIIIVVSIFFAADTNSTWFGIISKQQFYGLVFISVGLYCYDRWGSRSLKENRK